MSFRDKHSFGVAGSHVGPYAKVLVIGLDPLSDRCRRIFLLFEAKDLHEAHQHCRNATDVAVMVFGPSLEPAAVQSFIREHAKDAAALITGSGYEQEMFRNFADRDRIFYLSSGALSEDHLLVLLLAAVAWRSRRLNRKFIPPATDESMTERLLDFCTRLSMQTDLAGATGLTSQVARELTGAPQGECHYYDAEAQTLSLRYRVRGDEPPESPAAGLIGFVARTGQGIHLDRIGIDPRYDALADDPGGSEEARFAAAPIPGPGNSVIGIITVVRDGSSAPFSEKELDALDSLAWSASPVFSQLAWKDKLQDQLLKRTERSQDLEVFRQEAVESRMRGSSSQSDVLRTLPPWLRRIHWALLGLLFLAVTGATWGRIPEHVTGPAILRARGEGRFDLAAFFPAASASQLRPGMTLQIKLDADNRTLPAIIDEVGQEALGPAAASRYAEENGLGSLVSTTGERVVVVHSMLAASLLPSEFRGDIASANASVAVRSQRIIFSVLPILKKLFGQGD